MNSPARFALFILLSMSLAYAPELAFAKDKPSPARLKVIDFEGDLVEGVNKRPLDSLSELSDAQKRKQRAHLYRKRKGFRTETQETIREMRYFE